MTLWNPLNVFSSSQRRAAGNVPTASFDPSRTGDPVGPSYDRPAIGFGETGLGAPSGDGESRRHPVGFAPWDEEPAQRYVTEFSFKRHHEMPRASVTPDRPVGDGQESWQTPELDSGGRASRERRVGRPVRGVVVGRGRRGEGAVLQARDRVPPEEHGAP